MRERGFLRCSIGVTPSRASLVISGQHWTTAEILEAPPDFEADDIREALLFAAETVRERELPLVTVP